MWVAAWNRPNKCFERCECGGADFGNPDVTIGMFWSGGRVADEYGQAVFAGQIPYGVVPEGPDQALIPNPAKKRAQMTLILRDHGPASEDPELLSQQLTSWSANCDSYECADVQFSAHSSPFCKVNNK